MTTQHKEHRPITVIIADRGCKIRWCVAVAAVAVIGWIVPTPLQALPEHNPVCQQTFLC